MTPGARDAYVDDGVGLAGAMDGARHKRGVLDYVGKADKLGSANALAVLRKARGFLDDLGAQQHGVHVDAGAQARYVDGRANAAGLVQCLGDAVHQATVGIANALVNQCGVAAQVIDAQGLGRAVKGVGQGHQVGVLAGGGDLRHGGNGDALVHNGDAVFALQALGRLDQVLRGGGDMVVHLGAHALKVLVRATHKRDAHGDGADVEVLLGDHSACLGDFCGRDRHAPLLSLYEIDEYFYSILLLRNNRPRAAFLQNITAWKPLGATL